MIDLALAAVLVGTAEAHHRESGRVYHLIAIADVPTTTHTHVCVRGKAVRIEKEADGDVHVRLEDPDGKFIVAESVPGMKVRGLVPKIGEWAKACGVGARGQEAQEVHPVERWE